MSARTDGERDLSGARRPAPGARRLALLSLGSTMSDVACLWFILIAAGARVDPDVALLAVGAGAVAASVPLLPAESGWSRP